MAEPFIAEIRVFSFSFAPKGWALCNGQLLPISQNQALFSLLGTTHGGNGQTTFALPDLQGRTPIHFGGGFALGQSGGEPSHTLSVQALPTHSHTLQASLNADSVSTPAGNLVGANPQMPFSTAAPNVTFDPRSVSSVGSTQPHNNLQPYLTLNFCMALLGIFPSRN